MFRSLDFYLARLRNASLSELLFRLREIINIEILRHKCRLSRNPLRIPSVPPELLHGLRQPNVCTLPLAAQFSDGRMHGVNASSRQRDEEKFRHVFFSRIKTAQLENDLRAIWEPARLQSSISALNNGPGTQGKENGQGLDGIFAWLADNPFPYGLHYLSVMECGLRIPVFVRYLSGESGMAQECQDTLLTAIHQHASLIERRLSLFSSLGNHTIAESVGLVFAGGVFACSEDGRRWLEKGRRLLAQELTHQILPDGGPAEQSLSYHRFVLDLYWLAVDFLESNGLHDCSDWKARLKAGEYFLAAFTDALGALPAIGDSDDGHAIAPDLAPQRFEVSLCPSGIETFSESGYTVVRLSSGLLLTVDHGPLGMAPLYNHGHADALSFTLGMRGVMFFVDPGTYRYNGVPKHRQYFKGTRAHNTIAVDSMDQARQLTSFIWDEPYEAGAKILMRNGAYEIDAWHDGYRRLPMPVTHRRVFHVEEDTIRIYDFFQGEGVHDFDLHLHLHPEVKSNFCGDILELKRDGLAIALQINGLGKLDLVTGQDEPLLGWYSPAYGEIMPTTAVRFRQRGEPADVRFETCIQLKVV